MKFSDVLRALEMLGAAVPGEAGEAVLALSELGIEVLKVAEAKKTDPAAVLSALHDTLRVGISTEWQATIDRGDPQP